MPQFNAYAQYANNRIMTASPAELTLMLYEGAIKFNNIAITAIQNRDMQKAHINIVKSENVINYLQQTLDPSYEVSKDFDNIYDYVTRRLLEANIGKDIAILEEVNEHLRSLRDTWKEVMRLNGMTGHI
jgi:flagellar protein FliS